MTGYLIELIKYEIFPLKFTVKKPAKVQSPKPSILKRFCPKNYAIAGIFNSSK